MFDHGRQGLEIFRPLLDKGLVVPAVFIDHVHHAVDQGHVGPQVMAHVQMGQMGDLGLPGVDHDEPGAICRARMMRMEPMGCATVVLDPMTKMQLASSNSRKELVMAPLPNAAASPATVGACQRRAQWSIWL